MLPLVAGALKAAPWVLTAGGALTSVISSFFNDEASPEDIQRERDQNFANYVARGMDEAEAEALVDQETEDALNEVAASAGPNAGEKIGSLISTLGLAGFGAQGISSLLRRGGASAAKAALSAGSRDLPSMDMISAAAKSLPPTGDRVARAIELLGKT